MDALLRSGALAPRELGYLARQDITLFDGAVSFPQALDAYIGRRALSALKSGEVGDIGEAVVAHDLARKGYRDLVPIQNNSGHGNDLVGINPETGHWEVVEVKASVKGIARAQGGDPENLVTSRLNLAVGARDHWHPRNMWEEQAQSTADQIIKETLDPETLKVDVDPKWARVNLERDPVSGELKATPEIERWKTPAERTLEREQRRDGADAASPASPQSSLAHPDEAMAAVAVAVAVEAEAAPPLKLPTDLRDPAHPGHAVFERTLGLVHRMEDTRRIPHGPHSEQVAAALCVAAEHAKQSITHVELGADRRIYGIMRVNAFEPEQRVSIDPQQALSRPMEHHASQWAQARSPHYASTAPAAVRTHEQAQALALLPPGDRQMFDRIRSGTPAHISDDVVATALYAAKKNGIGDASTIATVDMMGDRLVVNGTILGFRAIVDTSRPAPALQATAQDTLAFNQQQALALQEEEAQRLQRRQDGPARSV